MNAQTSPQHTSASAESDAGSATLRFRHDQISSGVSRLGRLRPGGQLHIEYDPARLFPTGGRARAPDIVCHVRFYPGGKERGGSLQARPGVATGPGLFETIIPPETSSVEVWFECRAGTDVTGWDSRYGQNFRFAVTPTGLPVPERSVELRPQALVDPTRIWVVEDTASKAHASAGSGGAALQTGLNIRAQVGVSSSRLTAWGYSPCSTPRMT